MQLDTQIGGVMGAMIAISEDELSGFLALSTTKTYRRNEILIQPGMPCVEPMVWM